MRARRRVPRGAGSTGDASATGGTIPGLARHCSPRGIELDTRPPCAIDSPVLPHPARRSAPLLLLAALLASACFAPGGASPNAIPLVRVHAEADLDCPGNEIRITQ